MKFGASARHLAELPRRSHPSDFAQFLCVKRLLGRDEKRPGILGRRGTNDELVAASWTVSRLSQHFIGCLDACPAARTLKRNRGDHHSFSTARGPWFTSNSGGNYLEFGGTSRKAVEAYHLRDERCVRLVLKMD
jgi:hypothetical protein